MSFCMRKTLSRTIGAAWLVLAMAALPGLSGCRKQPAPGAPATAPTNAISASHAASASQMGSLAGNAAVASHAADSAKQPASAPPEALAPLSPQVLAVAQTVPKPAMRIVALNSNALEALRLLQTEDRVIGVFSGILHRFDF